MINIVIPAGEGWMGVVPLGAHIRFTDIAGNQAADTLFYDAADRANRYSAVDTIRRNRALYLSTGTVLYSTRGEPLLTIVDDTCGRHDTLGGACAAESNQVRYALDKRPMHACRDTYLLQLASNPCACEAHGGRMSKRDIGNNINFFMNVPVTPDGHLQFDDGVSGPGRYVELRAERDVVCLLSNCPQLNNPCNGYDPTPVGVEVWRC